MTLEPHDFSRGSMSVAVYLGEYSTFDKNGMRTLGFMCGGLEKVEMKVPKMWGAA